MPHNARRAHRPFLLFAALSLLAAAAPAVPVAAQAASAPLILWVAGDLWQADALNPSLPPVQRTFNGTISRPAIAATSNEIAYRAVAPVGMEALGRLQTDGAIADFQMPTDMYVYDLATGQSVLIAGQPDDSSLFVEGVPDQALVRGAPAWPPLGDAAGDALLSWAELPFGQPAVSLTLYDPVLGAARTLADGLPLVDNAPPELRWGREEFAVDQGEVGGTHIFSIYTRAAPDIPTSVGMLVPPGKSVVLLDWVTDAATGLQRVGVLTSDSAWTFYDAASGTLLPAERPTRLRAQAGTASLQLRFLPMPEGDPSGSTFYWESFDPLAPDATTMAYAGMPAQVALSPDGRAIAALGYPSPGGVGIWRDGEVTALAGTGDGGLYVGAVLWGAMGWVMD